MDELVTLSKAMSDLNRLKIVALIAREKELCVCELSDTLKLSQPLVSRHLKQLKMAHVLESHKEGKWSIFTIHHNPSPLLKSYLQELTKEDKQTTTIMRCSTR